VSACMRCRSGKRRCSEPDATLPKSPRLESSVFQSSCRPTMRGLTSGAHCPTSLPRRFVILKSSSWTMGQPTERLTS